MKYSVHKFGDPVLREKAEPVGRVDDEIRKLANDMLETMHLEHGVGLAAQQVGKKVAMCVVDAPPEYDQTEDGQRINPEVSMPLVLINPEITEASKKTEVNEEGCLSFPDISVPVTRPVEVTVRFLDLKGKPTEIHLKKFFARVVQHEIDHLNGMLLVDRMSRLKKIALAGQLKRLKRDTQKQLELV